jgi:SAM-dependent methyltransferase
MERVEKGLAASGVDLQDVTIDDLAPVDQFHSRGREATIEIATLMNPTEGNRVLDVGCGFGGTARFLAHNYGCAVTGIDLTPEYIEVGKALNEMVGLEDLIDLEQGSAIELPYEDDSFDFVTTEHVQMNIADKGRFYSEISRVLKPEGRFVFHDIFCGVGPSQVHYPVPWADEQSLSYLVPVVQARSLMEGVDLDIARWHECDKESIAFFTPIVERSESEGPPPLGLHLLMGENGPEKLRNYLRNVEEGRVTIALGMAVKKG